MAKIKRFMSALITVAMLISCLPVIGIHAEGTVTVTTQNGVSLDGLTGMPLSFSPKITFPTAVADGTDLSGITLKTGDTILTTTPTQGTVTDGTFTEAIVVTPVLTAGTEYTLLVPAIGGNGATEVSFTTVSNPYILKEEFDGVVKARWEHGDNMGNTNLIDVNYLVDLDNDGNKDAIDFKKGRAYYSPTIDFPSLISMSNYNEIIVESKIKITNAESAYLNTDNSIYTGKKPLMTMRANDHTNYRAEIRTNTSGEITYGEGNGDLYNTGVKLYKDKWYTLRAIFSADEKKMRVYVEDEDGNCHEGTEQGFSYGLAINNLSQVMFPYPDFISQMYIDYVRIWDNASSSLGTVSATANDADLSGAENISVDGISATINLTNAITADDMANITVGNGTTVEKTLSDDGKTVTMDISGLDYNTQYTVNVPMMAGNKAATFSFTTELPPVPGVTYQNGTVLEGETSVPLEFDAAVSFKLPISQDADLSGITIDNGTISAEYADENTVNLSISGLEVRKYYTITIPALGENPATTVKFRTKDEDWYVWRAEFDGQDEPLDLEINDGNNGKDTESTIQNGYLYIPQSGGGNVTSINLGTGVDVSTGEKYGFETRVRYHMKTPREDGLLGAGKKLLIVLGQNDYNAQMSVSATEGKLRYGGGSDNATGTISDYDFKDNTWYTIRMEFNPSSTSYDLYVTPDGGDTYEVKGAGGASYALKQITRIRYSYRFDVYADVDYVRIWNEDLMPTPTIVRESYNDEKLDGAGNVKDGEKIDINFPYAITEADLTAIKLDDASISAELSEDGKKATVTLPDMTPRTFHKLTVEGVGDNKAQQSSFRAADEEYYLYRAEFDGYDDDSAWYIKLNSAVWGENNTSAYLNDGIYTETFKTHTYRAFYTLFNEYFNDNGALAIEYKDSKRVRPSQAIDCTGKENVTIETRFMVGEGKLDNQFFYLGNNIAMLGIGENRELRYDANAGTGKGEPFMVNDDEFVIEPNVWYTIKMKFDFVAQKYSVSVDDGNGNIANSGTLNFIYSHKKYEITDFRFSRMLDSSYAPMSIDYFRITDEDYGKAKVTYNDGVNLNNAATVGTSSNVFVITPDKNVTTTEGITVKDENGNIINTVCIDNGDNGDNTISVIQQGDFSYNTKYTLTIPASVLGSLSDQVINFTTIWDESATFQYPAGYTADDALNVVFFGGSITNQEGWRKYTSEWFKEKFPNSNCYNASVGGTGAEYGWRRLNRDVVSKDPDIVFVEYAVNDSTNTKTARYMESIVRTLNNLENPPIIIFVYTTVLDFNTNTYAIAEHERIAKAYGIPTINVHDYVQTMYNTDSQFKTDWDNKLYLPDSTHPTTDGSKIYGDYVTALLTSDSSKYFVKPASNSSVAALENAKEYLYEYENVNKTMTAPGKFYEYTFEGDEFIVQHDKAENGGKFSVAIDGTIVSDSVDTYAAGSAADPMLIYEGLGGGTHTVTITVLSDVNEKSTGTTVTIPYVFWKKADGITYTAPVFDANAVTENKLLTATASYTSYKTKNIVLIIALYDQNNRFTGLNKAEITTDTSGVAREISVSITPKAGDAKAKAFLWDGYDTMSALTDIDSIGF